VRDERSHPLPSPQFCVSCFGPGSCEVTVHPLVVPLPSLSLRTRDHREGWVGFLVRSDALLELLVPLGGVASRLVLGHQNLTLAHALQSLSKETKHGIPDLADREENRFTFRIWPLNAGRHTGRSRAAAGARAGRQEGAVQRIPHNRWLPLPPVLVVAARRRVLPRRTAPGRHASCSAGPCGTCLRFIYSLRRTWRQPSVVVVARKRGSGVESAHIHDDMKALLLLASDLAYPSGG
jgi:hypothetical protein